MPSNQEFAAYINRKTKADQQEFNDKQILDQGITEETHLKLRKLFEDFIILENELENARLKLNNNESEIMSEFYLIDHSRRGEASIEEYNLFFKNFYPDEVPFT